MLEINNYLYLYNTNIDKFIVDALKKPQTTYNIIYVIELFKFTEQNKFNHYFTKYIITCMSANQYNNARILMQNYNIPIFDILRSCMRKNIFNNGDDQMTNLKTFYYLCRGINNNVNKIRLIYLEYCSSEVVFWYHSVRKYNLAEVREVLFHHINNYFYTLLFISCLKKIEKQLQLEIKVLLLQASIFTQQSMFEPRLVGVICSF
jgi:hypothetical protein